MLKIWIFTTFAWMCLLLGGSALGWNIVNLYILLPSLIPVFIIYFYLVRPDVVGELSLGGKDSSAFFNMLLRVASALTLCVLTVFTLFVFSAVVMIAVCSYMGCP